MKHFVRKKKVIKRITFVIIVIAIITGIRYGMRTTYELNIPQIEDLTSIAIEQNAQEVVINDKEEMKNVLNVLNGEIRTTQKESVQDFPINASNEIKVSFNCEDNITTIFAYKEGNKCFIEQPYNGIYKILEEEYNWLEYFIIGEYKHNL